jgi:hypothetical protein
METVLPGVDPGLLTVEQQLDDALVGEPLAHVLVVQSVEMGIAIYGVGADDQPGDAMRTQHDRGQQASGFRLERLGRHQAGGHGRGALQEIPSTALPLRGIRTPAYLACHVPSPFCVMGQIAALRRHLARSTRRYSINLTHSPFCVFPSLRKQTIPLRQRRVNDRTRDCGIAAVARVGGCILLRFRMPKWKSWFNCWSQEGDRVSLICWRGRTGGYCFICQVG